MGYIMDDSKGYIDFRKERRPKKKSDKHLVKPPRSYKITVIFILNLFYL